MDAVITYVNGEDSVWLESYRKFIGKDILAKRFRDWGTLKYLLRGIEKYMSYVGNVYLVVASQSQVPSWADTSSLRIITHDMIIPEEYLPTFNCNPIEMYLHRIPGLSEEFIYFNDDFFPVGPSSEEDFFRNGKVVMSPSRDFLSLNMFKKICRNSDRVARRAAGKAPSPFFLRPQHCCAPMLKSTQEELCSLVPNEIEATASRQIRSAKDINQYVYSDYAFLSGHSVKGRLSNKHFSLASTSAESLKSFLENPSHSFVCINDVRLSESKITLFRDVILSGFGKMFPQKSKFEK